jgi:transposase
MMAASDTHKECHQCRKSSQSITGKSQQQSSMSSKESTSSSSSSPHISFFGRDVDSHLPLGEKERAAIVTLHQAGWTGKDIAELLKCNEHSVSLWLNRFEDENSLSNHARSGRPHSLDKEASHSIIQFSGEHHTAEPKDIRRELQLPASSRTVRRELNAAGLFSHIQASEHHFTEFDLQRRLAFANEYIHHNEAWWSRVFFSDETHFYLGHHGRIHVQCPIGGSHEEEYVRKEPQLHGKVSLWGCISAEGLGHAELYVGSLNSAKYSAVLRYNLIPTFRQFFPDGPWLFQQDNVRFHTSFDLITYLHEQGVTFLEWPAWSPDLNPIENLWNDMKRRVYNRLPQTMEQLEQFIREEWHASDLTFISRICRSMPDRLQLLLDSQGHKIDY